MNEPLIKAITLFALGVLLPSFTVTFCTYWYVESFWYSLKIHSIAIPSVCLIVLWFGWVIDKLHK